jgi:hypothetical protein
LVGRQLIGSSDSVSTIETATRARRLGVMTVSLHLSAKSPKITQSALADFSANEFEHPIASDPTKMPRIHGFYR